MTLGDDELARYARQIILPEIGGQGQRRLRAATVTVIGAGGLGAPAIAYLAGAGVGRLRIVDDDRVELSNLPRQTLFTAADVGLSKARATAASVARLNPHVTVEPIETRIDGRSARAVIAGSDVVLDGCDNFATRLAIADAALAARVPLVSAAVARFEGQLATYRGWEAGRPCYRCLVGTPVDVPGETCADEGILGPVTGTLGSLAALETIRQISPFSDDTAGRLLLLDLLGLRIRSIAIAKDPACPACASVQPQTGR